MSAHIKPSQRNPIPAELMELISVERLMQVAVSFAKKKGLVLTDQELDMLQKIAEAEAAVCVVTFSLSQKRGKDIVEILDAIGNTVDQASALYFTEPGGQHALQ